VKYSASTQLKALSILTDENIFTQKLKQNKDCTFLGPTSKKAGACKIEEKSMFYFF